MPGRSETYGVRATHGGHIGFRAEVTVEAGAVVVSRGQIQTEHLPRARVHVGPGLGPHHTDDPEALRTLARVCEAAASLLEMRQAQHATAKAGLR